jgi:hypothetical protein
MNTPFLLMKPMHLKTRLSQPESGWVIFNCLLRFQRANLRLQQIKTQVQHLFFLQRQAFLQLCIINCIRKHALTLTQILPDMKKIITLFSLLLLSWQLMAGNQPVQKSDSLKVNPVQISFIYPLSTLGSNGGSYINHLSINLLAGYNGGLDGVEFGGLLNINHTNASGVQFAGLANITGGHQEGVQMAGLYNSSSSATGFQSAGLVNRVSGDLAAVQMAGLFNMTSGQVKGSQISGLGSVASTVEGLQMSGIINTAREVDGSQISGLINTTGKLKGLQLGVFNFADSVESGVPLGFLSVVRKNGYRKLEIGTGDAFHTQASFKMGVPRFYNIFSLGYQAEVGEQDQILALGYGVGTQFMSRAKSALNLEINSYAFQKDGDLSFSFNKNVNQLAQIRIIYGLELSEGFGFYFGPTFNTLLEWNQQNNEQSVDMAPYTIFDKEFGNHSAEGWIGFNVGLRFF